MRGTSGLAGDRMALSDLAQAPQAVGSPVVNVAVFGALVLFTLVVVVRVGRTTKEAVTYSRRVLDQLGVTLFGVVLNRGSDRHDRRYRTYRRYRRSGQDTGRYPTRSSSAEARADRDALR